MDYGTIIIALISGLIYASVFYAKKYLQNGEAFIPEKFAATAIIGALVGVAFTLSGMPISQEGIEVQIVAYTGLIAIVESILKILVLKFAPAIGKATKFTN